MLKNIKKASKKRIATVALAGVIGVSSIGTATYAYKDEWTAKIGQGVSIIAGMVFPSIQPAIASHGDAKETALKTWVNQIVSDTQAKMEAFKTAEINRGKAEIDAHDADNRTKIKNTVDSAVQTQKDAQKAKDDASIKKEQNDLDKVVDDALNQLPK